MMRKCLKKINWETIDWYLILSLDSILNVMFVFILTNLGIAVISAKNTSYGNWEYKCSGGSWTTMNITYSPPLRKLNHSILLLTPSDSVRYVLRNESFYWKTREANKLGMVLQVLAWDQTDNQACGAYQHTASSWPDSMSMTFASGSQLRMSCDGRPGMNITF